MTLDLERIIKTDQEHLVHPQFHPNDHKQPFVWVSGEGAKLRSADGKEYKPADYLTTFAQFVKDNPEHIAAISILQKQPGKWNTAALSELREKLAAMPAKQRRGSKVQGPTALRFR